MAYHGVSMVRQCKSSWRQESEVCSIVERLVFSVIDVSCRWSSNIWSVTLSSSWKSWKLFKVWRRRTVCSLCQHVKLLSPGSIKTRVLQHQVDSYLKASKDESLNLPTLRESLRWVDETDCVVVHRVPKLVTPVASNTRSWVWSSRISMKYHTLHYLNITYCQEQVYKVTVNDADELRQRIQSPDCMGWTWSAYYDKAIKQWRT